MSDRTINMNDYRVEFQAFTGINLEKENKESFSLFFQFIQAKNSIEITQSTFKQANAIRDFVELQKKKS